jgi:RNA-directed DNA polymerase
MDALLFRKLYRWAYRKNIGQGARRIIKKYWLENWRFMTQEGYKLVRHADKKIVLHTKVKNNKSPFDGDILYWSTRLGRHPLLPANQAIALKRQKGRCGHCGLTFTSSDIIELHHINPIKDNGARAHSNLHALHGHCHDATHR